MFLDFFAALVMRFSIEMVKWLTSPIVRSRAEAMRKTVTFRNTRICQFHYLLDRGSLSI